MAEKESTEPSKLSEADIKFIKENKWVVRPCEQYYEEYRDCKRIRQRFHQYFIFGETLDCNGWYDDYTLCEKWEKNNQDVKTLKKIAFHEGVRKYKRFKPHYDNDVWEKRDSPPPDWNKEPPDWFKEENQGSYLAFKSYEEKQAKQSKQSGIKPVKSNDSSCVIS